MKYKDERTKFKTKLILSLLESQIEYIECPQGKGGIILILIKCKITN